MYCKYWEDTKLENLMTESKYAEVSRNKQIFALLNLPAVCQNDDTPHFPLPGKHGELLLVRSHGHDGQELNAVSPLLPLPGAASKKEI